MAYYLVVGESYGIASVAPTEADVDQLTRASGVSFDGNEVGHKSATSFDGNPRRQEARSGKATCSKGFPLGEKPQMSWET